MPHRNIFSKILEFQSKAAIFQLFDEDANGTLDPKEIGKLNATIFTIFPRFGYVSSEPPSNSFFRIFMILLLSVCNPVPY